MIQQDENHRIKRQNTSTHAITLVPALTDDSAGDNLPMRFLQIDGDFQHQSTFRITSRHELPISHILSGRPTGKETISAGFRAGTRCARRQSVCADHEKQAHYYIRMKHATGSLEFLRRVSRRRRSAQRSVASISEYMEEGAALLTPGHLDDLRTALPLLKSATPMIR